MTEIQFLENVDKIIEMLLKNAKHSFGINFKIVNDTDIELHKRLKAEQLDKKLEELFFWNAGFCSENEWKKMFI